MENNNLNEEVALSSNKTIKDEPANIELKVGDCIQVDDNEDKNVNNNGNIYMILQMNTFSYGNSLVRWKGNDCNSHDRPSLNSWSFNITRANLFKKKLNIQLENKSNQYLNFKIVESPDLGEWKKKVSWKKDNNMTILKIDDENEVGVEYKVGDCCKIDLGNKMKAIDKNLTVPEYDAIICEFKKNSDNGHENPTTESDVISELDTVTFHLFKPNFSEKINLNKYINIKPLMKIELSLMAIFNHGFIKNKIECPKYDPTQIKLITGGKRSRKVKKQRKSKKRKSRSRK
jgi:hypothetical protein